MESRKEKTKNYNTEAAEAFMLNSNLKQQLHSRSKQKQLQTLSQPANIWGTS